MPDIPDDGPANAFLDALGPAPRPPATDAAQALEVERQGMRWAFDNLRCGDPRALQRRGVDVQFAPNLERGRRLVDLRDGRIDVFQEGEHVPDRGWYASLESLQAYCLTRAAPLQEVEGYAVLLPAKGEAGDPLEHPRETAP